MLRNNEVGVQKQKKRQLVLLSPIANLWRYDLLI